MKKTKLIEIEQPKEIEEVKESEEIKKIKKTIFKDIYVIINKIKECNSKSKYSILLNELGTLYNLCREFDITDYPKIENYSYKTIEYYNNNIGFAYEILKNIEYHLEFAETNQIFNEKYKNQSYVIYDYYNSYKYLYIIKDFLNKYDPKLLKIFSDMLDEGRILVTGHINENDVNLEKQKNKGNKIDGIHTPAYTTCSYGSYKPYIVVEQENCVGDLVNLVHELAHTKEYLNTKSISSKILEQKEYNCLEEVHSYFLQNLFILYLEKIKFGGRDIKTIKLGFDYTFYEYIEKLWQCLLDVEDKQILDADVTEYLNYTYGIAIGYHFIDRYLKDPEKTKKEIDSFITLNGQYDMMTMLDKFDLKDELINSKVLKKYL